MVLVGVFVLVFVGVNVFVGVFVRVGVNVGVGVGVLVGVLVFVGVKVGVKQITVVLTVLESSEGSGTPMRAFPLFHWARLGMVAGQVFTWAFQVTVTDWLGATVPVFQLTAVPLNEHADPPVQLW